MRLDFNKLSSHFKQPLLPVYLITGDEPLQCGEASDLIRATARKQGYTEREILDVDNHFNWQQLAACRDTRSLFGDRRLIELRLSSSKIGNDGSAAVVAWCERPPADTILLIASPKLDRAQAGPKWVQIIEQKGGVLAIWPIEKQQLADWLEQRLKARGLIPEAGVAAWLAERVEGNLLAGVQEIEKLLLLQNVGPLTLDQTIAAASDSARYNVFELADACVDGDASRGVRILRNLRDDGTANVLVLWALVKEIRLLTNLSFQAQHGAQVMQLIASRREIRERRRSSYMKALKRISTRNWQQLLLQCTQADLSIKGQIKDDPWLLLEQIVLGISGVVVLST